MTAFFRRIFLRTFLSLHAFFLQTARGLLACLVLLCARARNRHAIERANERKSEPRKKRSLFACDYFFSSNFVKRQVDEKDHFVVGIFANFQILFPGPPKKQLPLRSQGRRLEEKKWRVSFF